MSNRALTRDIRSKGLTVGELYDVNWEGAALVAFWEGTSEILPCEDIQASCKQQAG